MNSIGLQRGTVALHTYSPQWVESFKAEKRSLLNVLGDMAIAIEHIGSTSVPGLSAKPIIDMLMGVKRLSDVESMVSLLEKHGYEHRPNGSTEDKMFFVKGPEEHRTHYLHITEVGSTVWEDDIVFRDYLRAHPEAVKEYEVLKQCLAVEHADNRGLYTEGKAAFIRGIIAKAQ